MVSEQLRVERAELIREANIHPYKSVFGSPVCQFFEESLDALNELPHVEFVWFWNIDLKNIEGIYALSKLKSFGVHPKRPAIDFSRLQSLREMVWIYKPTDKGVSSLQLKRLHVWRYAPTSISFAGLERIAQVSQIMFPSPFLSKFGDPLCA